MVSAFSELSCGLQGGGCSIRQSSCVSGALQRGEIIRTAEAEDVDLDLICHDKTRRGGPPDGDVWGIVEQLLR